MSYLCPHLICHRYPRSSSYHHTYLEPFHDNTCPRCQYSLKENASWTFEGVDGMWRATARDRPAAEVWQQKKAVLLERWLLEKHAEITRDFRINTQHRVYYWC